MSEQHSRNRSQKQTVVYQCRDSRCSRVGQKFSSSRGYRVHCSTYHNRVEYSSPSEDSLSSDSNLCVSGENGNSDANSNASPSNTCSPMKQGPTLPEPNVAIARSSLNEDDLSSNAGKSFPASSNLRRSNSPQNNARQL